MTIGGVLAQADTARALGTTLAGASSQSGRKLALSLLVVVAACQVGEGQADSLAVAQTTTPSPPAPFVPPKESPDALANLGTVDLHVTFEDFAGVDTAALRSRVEHRLRAAGLAVDSTARPTLLVRCFALASRTPVVAYSCAVDLADVVTYENPTKGRYRAIVWGGAPMLGTAGQAKLGEGVTAIVDDVVSQFVSEWSRVNAR